MARRKRFGLPQGPGRTMDDPTPTEIVQKCEEIRARWSASELNRRSGMHKPTPWMPPVVHALDLPAGEEAF